MQIYFAVILILLTSGLAHADLESIQNCVRQKYKTLTKFHGIVAAILDSKETRIMTFGAAKENQIFEIGSITKTFTGNLLAQSVVEGSLKLTDSIPKEYQKNSVPDITYQHLTTHTSGIIVGNFSDYQSPNPYSPYEGLNIPLFKRLYANTPLATLPGEKWSYSNIGSGLLGIILSENENLSYDELVTRRILKRIGMHDTYFEVPNTEKIRFPQGFVSYGTEMVPFSYWDLFNTAINPAGGIRSTISDMALYARANLIPESTELVSSISLSQEPLYLIKDKMWMGMNWVLEPEKKLIWHNGSTIGFKSILAISKKHNIAIVALTDTTVFMDASNGELVKDESLEDTVFLCLTL